MNKFLLCLCITLLAAGQLDGIFAQADHTFNVALQIPQTGCEPGDAGLTLLDTPRDHDGHKQVIKMPPTEITEEEEDENEVISFRYLAAFFISSSVESGKESLIFRKDCRAILSNRRHLLFQVFRI